MAAAQVAQLVRHHGFGLLGRKALQQRQPDEQEVARPTQHAQARLLHHGGVEIVGEQNMMETRRIETARDAIDGGVQGRRFRAGQLAPGGPFKLHPQ